MTQRLFLLILLFYSFNVSCTSDRERRKERIAKGSVAESDYFFAVSKVVDGDTFWIYDGAGNSVKIRLIGVDAPESRRTFKKEVGYFGKEAKSYLISLLTGKKVRLEFDVNRMDQYGRSLAYVYLQDGTFVNADLVEKGYAMVMTVPPNVKYADFFLKLQQEARENNVGLWNAGDDN